MLNYIFFKQMHIAVTLDKRIGIVISAGCPDVHIHIFKLINSNTLGNQFEPTRYNLHKICLPHDLVCLVLYD